MAKESKLRYLLTSHYKFMASLIFLLIALILLFILFNEPAHTIVVHRPMALSMDSSGFNGTTHIWTNTTKTTGGWPLLKNDIYNTMGLALNPHTGNYTASFYDGPGDIPYSGKWTMSFILASIAGARIKDTDKRSNSINSQILKVIFPKVINYSYFGTDTVGITTLSTLDLDSWPCIQPVSEDLRDGDYNFTDLFSSVIHEINNDTLVKFPLSSSEFAQSRGRDIWSRTYVKNHPEILEIVNFPYVQKLNNNISDCGYTYFIGYEMAPGSTHEFDIITDTDWGLFDSSQVSLHVKITAPINPSGMPDSELAKYGIRTYINPYDRTKTYLIDASNISIAVT